YNDVQLSAVRADPTSFPRVGDRHLVRSRLAGLRGLFAAGVGHADLGQVRIVGDPVAALDQFLADPVQPVGVLAVAPRRDRQGEKSEQTPSTDHCPPPSGFGPSNRARTVWLPGSAP